MAQSVKDSKDYSSVPCGEDNGNQKEGKDVVGSGTPRSVKLSESLSSSESSLAFSDAFGLPPAPDGGWGWFIVLGAFFMSVICDGCAFTFGVLFVYLLEEFQETKSQTAWIASIFYCFALILGPVASALTTRFGCRLMTIAAGLVSFTGFVLSSFVTSIWQLYITFGVLVGCGFSVCYVTIVLTVAYYFDKRRALATGLAVCGTGIGTFTFAPLTEFLCSLYGWRGTFLIIGAISLNICVCGALFRPLTFTPEQRRQCHLNAFDRLTRPVSRLSIPSRNRSRLHSTNSESTSSSSSDSEDDIAALAYSQIALPTYVNADEDSIKLYLDKLPELRRTTADPQLALQRFFKSRDIEQASARDPRDSKSEVSTKVTNKKQLPVKQNVEAGEVFIQPSDKKRRKRSTKTNQQKEAGHDKLLSKEALQQLAEKLESNCDTGKKSRYDPHQQQKDDNLQSENLLGRTLERTQSEKTPNKLSCKVETGKALERSLSDKIPATLLCQAETSAVSFVPVKTTAESHVKVSTGVAPRLSSNIDPALSSGNDMGILLLNKHSTYLILHRNDIFFRGSYARRPVPCATSCPELSRLPSSDSESDDSNCLVDECPCLQPVVDILEKTFDKKIISHPLFILLALSNFLLYFWGDVPYVFAPDFAQSMGISESQATLLISVIGIVNTIGQVVYGLVGDQDWNLTVIYGISCIASGLAVVLLPTATSYWLMCVLCGLFGFFLSANFSLLTVMLVGHLGLEKLANAYGLIMMIQGIANLGGPPMTGWIVDSSGNYDLAFPIAGGFIMLSGIIIFFLYILRLCSRFCHHCCSAHNSGHGQPRHCGDDTKNDSSDATWTNGPPAADQAVV